MTEPDLTPEQDLEVRRLLADARHTEPIPAAVADRLDGVLADLAAEPARRAPVTQLATRRRRAATMLVAAAAVVVAGIGLGQMVGGSGQDADSAGDSTSADSAGGSGLSREPLEEEPAGSPRANGNAAESQPVPEALQELVRLRPQRLGDDVLAARAATKASGDAATPRGGLPPEQRSAFADAGVACDPSGWGRGTVVAVRYGDVPAVLVLRRPLGDSQVADVFLCGQDEPERTITLPAP